MKKILLFLFILFSVTSFGQAWQPYSQYGLETKAILGKRAVLFPTGCGDPALYNTSDSSKKMAGFYFDSCSNTLWVYDPKLIAWNTIGSGSGGGLFGSTDIRAAANRTFYGNNNTYSFAFDSLNSFSVSRNGIPGRIYMNNLSSGLYSPSGLNSIQVSDAVAQLNFNSNQNYIWTLADSLIAHKRISYEGNIHGTFNQYSLVDKKYTDSLIATAGSSLTFEESVVNSNDSVFLEGEKTYPARLKTVYGDSSGTMGFHNAAIINEVDIQDESMIKYNSGTAEYNVFKSDTLLQDLSFTVGDTGFDFNGEDTLIIPAIKSRKLKIHISGILMREGIDYSKTNDSTIAFAQQLETDETVHIETIANFITSTIDTTGIATASGGGGGGGGGCSEVYADFVAAGDLAESPTGTWSSAAQTGLGYSTTSLPSGTAGTFTIQNNASNSDANPFGLDDVATNGYNYPFWECTMFRLSGVYYYYDAGGSVTSSGITATTGDWLRFRIDVGGTITGEYSTNSGSTWSTVHVFSLTGNHTLYAKIDLTPVGSKIIQEAKLCGFQ